MKISSNSSLIKYTQTKTHALKKIWHRWKLNSVKLLWRTFGHVASSAKKRTIEKTFSFNDKNNPCEIGLVEPQFNDTLPGFSFSIFLRDLQRQPDPNAWFSCVFTKNRDRLLRFRPDKKQTAKFLEALENQLKKSKGVAKRDEKLAAVRKIIDFNKNQQSLFLDYETPSVFAFNLALRICDPGLIIGQTKIPTRESQGLSGTNSCGAIALMTCACHEEPYEYTRFCLQLASKGKAKKENFSLSTPTSMEASPDVLDQLNPFDRTIIGSFSSTLQSFLPTKGVYPNEIKTWLRQWGWKNANMIWFPEKDPEKPKKLAKSMEAACKKGPIIIYGDFGIVEAMLPEKGNTKPTKYPKTIKKTGSLHFTSIVGCKAVSEKKMELTVINFGITRKIIAPKKSFSTLVDAIVCSVPPDDNG